VIMILGDGSLVRGQEALKCFKAIGTGVEIGELVKVSRPDLIEVGDYTLIHDFAVLIGHSGFTLGRHVQICSYCLLGGSGDGVLKIGDYSTLAAGTRVYTIVDDFHGELGLAGAFIPDDLCGCWNGDVLIGKYVSVGANCVILPSTFLGDGVALGALSLAKGSLSEWLVYGGVPARPLKTRKSDVILENSRILDSRKENV